MVFDTITRQADDLHAALFEFRLQLRHITELGRADRGEILRMRENDRPAVADPIMELDRAVGRLCLKVRCDVA